MYLQNKAAQGFSLVEMMCALAVLATVAAMSVPSLGQLLTGQRLRSASMALHTSLMLARSTAVQLGQRVAVCPSADAKVCTGSLQWATGWMIFVDHNHDRQRQPSETLLQVSQQQDRLSISSNIGRPVVIFHPDGTAAGFNTTFRLCAMSSSQTGRSLVLANSGRLRPGPAATCAG
jgi:type IV fimbrial biogenesis protein FimT